MALMCISFAYCALLCNLYENNKISKTVLKVLIAVYFILVVGLRYLGAPGSGVDEGNYRDRSIVLKGVPLDPLKVFAVEGGEYLMEWIGMNWIHTDQAIIFLFAFFTFAFMIPSMIDYAEEIKSDLTFVFLIFIFAGYLDNTTNGSRQCMAAGILTFAFRYIERKKYWAFVLLCILATWIHFSSLIMIPMLLVLTCEEGSKRLFIYLLTMLVFFLAIPLLLPMWQDIYHVGTFNEHIGEQVSSVRILFWVVQYGIALFFYYKGKIRIPFVYMIYCMMTVLLFLCSRVFLYTSRLTYFFEPISMLVLPKILGTIEWEDRKKIRWLVVVVYLVFGFISPFGKMQYHMLDWF